MAKTKTQTLEDFIKKYTLSGTKSYSDFLRGEADDSEYSYASALKNANKTYDRARAHYGASGEAAARRGLTGSGYSDYLDANAYSEMQKTKQDALEKKNVSDAQNRIKYADYLRTYESEREKKLRETIDRIAEYAPKNEELANEYALYSGLDTDIAKEVAALGIELGKKEMSAKDKQTLINTLVTKSYSRGNLYYYLTAIGMSQDEANELADTIYKLSGNKKYNSWSK